MVSADNYYLECKYRKIYRSILERFLNVKGEMQMVHKYKRLERMTILVNYGRISKITDQIMWRGLSYLSLFLR